MMYKKISINKLGHKFNEKGIFSFLEYGILILIVAIALIGMFMYLKLAICGRWRESIDTYGDGRLYYPYVTNIERN